MKELTIEQKAQRYDDAIDKIKYVMEHGVSPTLNKEDLQDIFPELKESEDERIRKELIAHFKTNSVSESWSGLNVKKVIAWLEKQGEQKLVPDWMPKFLDELRSKKNYFDWCEHKDIEGDILAIIKWLNPNYFNGKDDEQKPYGQRKE